MALPPWHDRYSLAAVRESPTRFPHPLPTNVATTAPVITPDARTAPVVAPPDETAKKLAEISDRLGIAKATVHGLLRALEGQPGDLGAAEAVLHCRPAGSLGSELGGERRRLA